VWVALQAALLALLSKCCTIAAAVCSVTDVHFSLITGCTELAKYSAVQLSRTHRMMKQYGTFCFSVGPALCAFSQTAQHDSDTAGIR
jgi:hypothetical protein